MKRSSRRIVANPVIAPGKIHTSRMHAKVGVLYYTVNIDNRKLIPVPPENENEYETLSRAESFFFNFCPEDNLDLCDSYFFGLEDLGNYDVMGSKTDLLHMLRADGYEGKAVRVLSEKKLSVTKIRREGRKRAIKDLKKRKAIDDN